MSPTWIVVIFIPQRLEIYERINEDPLEENIFFKSRVKRLELTNLNTHQTILTPSMTGAQNDQVNLQYKFGAKPSMNFISLHMLLKPANIDQKNNAGVIWDQNDKRDFCARLDANLLNKQ